MVRLSEGLAKLYGSEEVLIRHVTEAAYLLKTSIVHIEQETVVFEGESESLLPHGDVVQMDIDDQSANNQDSDQVSLPLFYLILAPFKKHTDLDF